MITKPENKSKQKSRTGTKEKMVTMTPTSSRGPLGEYLLWMILNVTVVNSMEDILSNNTSFVVITDKPYIVHSQHKQYCTVRYFSYNLKVSNFSHIILAYTISRQIIQGHFVIDSPKYFLRICVKISPFTDYSTDIRFRSPGYESSACPAMAMYIINCLFFSNFVSKNKLRIIII